MLIACPCLVHMSTGRRQMQDHYWSGLTWCSDKNVTITLHCECRAKSVLYIKKQFIFYKLFGLIGMNLVDI